MDRKLVYSAYGALILAAGAFGVHVGESAIGQINPLYFQGAAVHPRDRGAVVTDASVLVEQGPRFAELYGWAEGAAARAADCGDCDALAARDAYAGRGGPRYAVAETGWGAEPQNAGWAPAPQDQLTVEEEPSPYEAQRAALARYAAYQIEEKPEGEAAVEETGAETTDVAGL